MTSSASIQLQPALVLHTREFRNTSLLVDLISPEHGRLRAVARGARRNGSRHRPLLQLFHPVLVCLQGRGELLTLTDVESAGSALMLRGERLFSGLYLNELVVRMLPMHQPGSTLFARYHETLRALADDQPVEPLLRYFEMDLLEESGYGLDLWHEADSGAPLEVGRQYLFHPEQGFERVPDTVPARNVYDGAVLVALRERTLTAQGGQLPMAKWLLRQALAPHLGQRPLKSREYFARLSPGRSGR
ncbi:MAG: DNA repair protein RecO [Pseudohongiellaceae bacterium]